MYPDLGWQILAVAEVVWILVLSFVVLRQEGFLKSLFPKSGTRDIRKKFEEVVEVISQFEKKFLDVGKRLDFIEEDSLRHIQKVNPYEDTGGDQSFTACFLDKFGTGFVITSLHTRSGTRVFAKPVVKGKGTKHQLSKEEHEVVAKVL